MWIGEFAHIKFQPRFPFSDSSLSIEKVADLLQTSTNYVKFLIKKGVLHRGRSTNKRKICIQESELNRFLREEREEHERLTTLKDRGELGVDF